MSQVPPVTLQSAAELETLNDQRANCRRSFISFMSYRTQTLVLVTLHLGFSDQSRFDQ